jgi:HSP20 family protein
MTMQRWEPFKEMMSLRDAMDRLFEDSFVRPWAAARDAGLYNLPLDIYQTDKDVIVKASIPGYKPEEVDITVSGDTLTIKAEHKEEKETKEGEYMLKERQYGTFTRTVTIPVDIQSDKSEASFEDGVLTLQLPKSEEVRPRQIKIKSKPQIETGKK